MKATHTLQKCFTADKRFRILLLSGILLLAAAMGFSLCMGSSRQGIKEALYAIGAGGDTALYRIIVHVRLPRVLGAVLAGGALSVAGAVMQSVMENPLASPNIIGVNAGAGLGVLLWQMVNPSNTLMQPAAAFAGALAAALLVLGVSAGAGASNLTVILAGFGISSVFNAGINAVMILFPDAYIGSASFLTGGLSGVTLKGLLFPALYIAAGMGVILLLSPKMNILSLGGETAMSLGMRVTRVRFILLAAAAAVSGAAVSFGGLMGFAGFVVPHGVRFFAGHDNRYVTPLCMVYGGLFVLLCDLAARTLFVPYELPVGILLAFIGGPVFVCITVRKGRGGYGGA